MFSSTFRSCLIVSLLAFSVATATASPSEHPDAPVSYHPLFHASDPLAPRDEWGLLHQMSTVYPVDFSHRYSNRVHYYLMSGPELLADPAYVGALQVCLRNRGYYCGPINGINSEQVSDAIARLQKNHTQRVTGTLTIPVRRVLHLP